MIQATNKISSKTMVYAVGLLLLMGQFCTLGAQVGLTTVQALSTHRYQFNNALVQKAPSWVIVGGTEVSSGSSGTHYFVDVQWGSPGSGYVTFKDKNTIRGTLNVTIEGSSPPSVSSTDQNYIKNTVYRVPTTTGTVLDDEKTESITYFDGLGRPMQSVGIRAGGSHEDIVTHISYDDYGRQDKEYLPYAITSTGGLYQSSAESATKDYYYNATRFDDDFIGLTQATVNPYSEKNLEASPLSRVIEQGAPGADWILNETLTPDTISDDDTDHTIKFEYATNTEADYVKLYKVTFSGGNTKNPQLVDSGEYPAGELYKTITKDENWKSSDGVDKTTEEYKNKQGQVILKRTFNNTKWHDTYYVYDDFGNLTYVLPPKLNTYKFIDQQNWESEYFDISSLFIDNGNLDYAYGYLGVSTSGILYLDFEVYYSNIGVEFKNSVFPLPGSYSNLPDMNLGDIYFYNGNLAGTFSIVSGNLHIVSSGLKADTYNSDYYDGFNIDLSAYQSTYAPPVITEQGLNNLAYQYKYDNRNRLVEKKIPGKGWEYIVYNKLDQPIMTQDAELNNQSKYLFTKYDAFGRVVYTGIYDNHEHYHEEQVYADGTSDQYETRSGLNNVGGTGIYYTENAYPNYVEELFTVNYYDDYIDLPTGFTAPTKVYGQTVTTNTKGLPTVSKVRVLDVSPDKWITTVTYYDKKARPIYVYSENEYLGTTDIIETEYDFVKVIKTKNTHQKTGQPDDIVTVDSFEYDHAGRLLAQTQSIGSNNELIVLNNYDELGQLESKKVGGAVAANVEDSPGLQTVDYAYNIRGWLKQINDPNNLGTDLFSFGINYNTPSYSPSSSTSYNTALYNGNISHVYWKTNNEIDALREYAYKYDDLNRFTYAYYAQSGVYSSKYNTYIYGYDKNGNIERLIRYMPNDLNDHNSTGSIGMDYLTYEYDNGNKLLSVKDSYGLSTTGAEGFKEGNTSGDDYLYDDNGNVIKDLNKGINQIYYNNHLNLPTNVYINNGGSNNGNIAYTYDATGVKLKKVVSGSTSGTTEYAGNYVYKDGDLQFLNHPEGYLEPKNHSDLSQGFNYIYQYKDHLGNVRLSYTDSDNNGAITGEYNYTTVWEDGFESASGWDGSGSSIWGWPISQYDNTFKRSGSYSGKLDPGANWIRATHHNDWQTINNPQATYYIYSCWVYLENVSGNKANIFLFMNESGETGYYTEISSISTYITGKWVYLEKKVSVPANITGLNIRLDSQNAGVVWFDDVKIMRVDKTSNSEIVEENNYYPFGLRHKGYNNVVTSTNPAQNYTYNGKEEQEELGLNWLDYGARNYDASLGRWMNIDNLAEQYKTSSPYHYAGNNPILNYDIDGNEFPESAWKWVNKLIANMDSRIDYYDNRIAKTKQKLKDGEISQKTADRRLNRLSSNKSDLNAKFDVVRGEIATLEASDQVYDVVGDSGGTERDLLGNSTTTNTTSFNFSNGNVEITASSGTDLSLFAHELKHAYQFEIGEISFGRKRADFAFGIDKYDELAGKQRGALFGGSNINSIQDLGSRYDGLPDGPYNSNSVKWIRQALQYQTAEEQQKRLKQVATSFRHAFRVNGKTYYKKKE